VPMRAPMNPASRVLKSIWNLSIVGPHYLPDGAIGGIANNAPGVL